MKTRKTMKRVITMIVVLCLALTALSAAAFADEGDRTMYCTARSGLMVRTAPTSQAPSVGSFSYGQDVRVVGDIDVNGWAPVDWNGYVRYAYAGYLSYSQPSDSEYSWLNTNTNVAYKSTYTVSVAKNYLALRSGCTFDENNEIAHLYNGTTVELLNQGDGTYWAVYVPSLNMSGYVNSNYLV